MFQEYSKLLFECLERCSGKSARRGKYFELMAASFFFFGIITRTDRQRSKIWNWLALFKYFFGVKQKIPNKHPQQIVVEL